MSHRMLQFTDSTSDLAAAIGGTFDPVLVVLSFVIASASGYTALLIAERIGVTETRRVRLTWLAAGAFAMGSGIWAMHFVGMLAFTLPIAVTYDRNMTALSMLPAILASGAALHFMKASRISFWRLNLGGLLMASGIGAMHFTGMAAMIMDAEMRYDPALFVASIAIAHALATLALYGKLVLGKATSTTWGRTQFASAVVMGCAVGCMHYTAMAAALYFPGGGSMVPISALSNEVLAFATTLLVGLILGTAIITTVIDRRLQDAHSQLKSILDSAGEGIYGLDLEGRTTFVNPAAAQMIGWDVEELIGKSRQSVLHHTRVDGTPYPPEEYSIYAALRDGAVHHIRDGVFWRRDGTSFPVEYVSSPMRAANGDWVGTVVTFRDLTEQRRLEAQLVQAQKLESIGQLAAGIAHEINTPAQYLSDNLQFLRDSFAELTKNIDERQPARGSTKDDDIQFLLKEIPRALDQSIEGTERISSIVRAMKEFSHPGSVDPVGFDLNAAVRSTLTVARNEWKYVAEVELDLEEGLRPIVGLPGEVNQAILNIVVNAAHAIAEVTDNAAKGKGTIRIQTRTLGPGAEVRISDTGGGIPEEIRNRIFDPFFTTKGVGKGTGQGLAIAYSSIVDKHGGSLRLDTEPAQGTTFVLLLPWEGVEASQRRAEQKGSTND